MEVFNTVGIGIIIVLLAYVAFSLNKKGETEEEYSSDDLNNPLNQIRDSIEKTIGMTETALSKENTNVKNEVLVLTSIFNSPQELGGWGERSLEEILKLGGYKKPKDYEVQKSTPINEETGKRGKPDITLKLYDNKKLIVDSKLPTKNYTKYIAAINKQDDENEDSSSRKEMLSKYKESAFNDIKGHIDKVSSTQGYIDPTNGTLEFAMMYIPLEPIYQFAMTGHFIKNNEKIYLFDYALDNNVIVTSPSMVLVYLATIKNAIDKFYIQEKHLELLDLHSKFIKQWDSWDNAYQDLQDSVTDFQDSFATSMKSYSDTRYKKLDTLVALMKDLVTKK